jgi:DNA-binding PadR family transcriptional regulator
MRKIDQCPCSGGTLDKLLRPAILSVLAKESIHGYLIVKQLSSLRISRGEKPDATGVYRALGAMQVDGFVASRWVTSRPGPAKHLYRLTPAGRACLTRWVRTLVEHEAAIGELLQVARRASGVSSRACTCTKSPRRNTTRRGAKS